MVQDQQHYQFNPHAELFQKQQKTRLLGLFKYQAFPTFENQTVPFDIFRRCLDLFLKDQDAEIEKLLVDDYV